MKFSLASAGFASLFLTALVVVGCSPSQSLEPIKPADSKVAEAKPTDSVKGKVDAVPTPPVAKEAPKDAPPPNPNRAFQLSSLDHAALKVNGTGIDAWVMDTEPKRQEGMMFLKNPEVRDDQGMIFVFPAVQLPGPNHGFWMHNTILPLDIVYIASDYKVLNVQAGKPQDDTSLAASGAYWYVLELKQGEAKKLGIKPGTKIEMPKTLKATE